MKKKKLIKNTIVYLAFYRGEFFGVYLSAASRREHVIKAILEGGYLVDKFFFDEHPIL